MASPRPLPFSPVRESFPLTNGFHNSFGFLSGTDDVVLERESPSFSPVRVMVPFSAVYFTVLETRFCSLRFKFHSDLIKIIYYMNVSFVCGLRIFSSRLYLDIKNPECLSDIRGDNSLHLLPGYYLIKDFVPFFDIEVLLMTPTRPLKLFKPAHIAFKHRTPLAV